MMQALLVSWAQVLTEARTLVARSAGSLSALHGLHLASGPDADRIVLSRAAQVQEEHRLLRQRLTRLPELAAEASDIAVTALARALVIPQPFALSAELPCCNETAASIHVAAAAMAEFSETLPELLGRVLDPNQPAQQVEELEDLVNALQAPLDSALADALPLVDAYAAALTEALPRRLGR
jgi:hypothetical protein